MAAISPPGRGPLGYTAVYRLYDTADRLLYVGITGTLRLRLKAHSKTAAWWPSAVRATVMWHRERANAEQEESRAILAEGPLHNAAAPPKRVPTYTAHVNHPTCTANQARIDLSNILDAALFAERPTVTTRSGQPRAAFVPYPWLEELEAYRAKYGPLGGAANDDRGGKDTE